MLKILYTKKDGIWATGYRANSFVLSLLALVAVAITATYAKGTLNGRTQQGIRLEERLEAEQRLSNLGYWTGPVDGNFDSASRHALIAFQKVEARERTGRLTRVELQALRTATRPVPRDTDATHLEIDIRRQVLFIVADNGSITHILPVCTGNEKLYMDHGQVHKAHTPRGEFKVLRKIARWRLSSLGLLYYPNYIREGVAIHGSPAMSVYPASHGCIRIPMFAAKEFSQLVPVGMKVIVYDG